MAENLERSNEDEIPIDARKRKLILQAIKKERLNLFQKHHRNTSGKRMTFDDMPYMMKIFQDAAAEVVMKSSVQTGKTEEATVDIVAALKVGLKVFHVFPTDTDKNKFFEDRMDPLCDTVPEYARLEKTEKKKGRNRYMRTMGAGRWCITASNSPSGFKSFPADMVVIEELDECNQTNIKKASDRMQNSPYKLWRLLGNPTVPNTGIAKEFVNTDQKVWHYKCSKCKEFFKADFFETVVEEKHDAEGNHISYKLYDTEWSEKSNRDVLMRCPLCKKMQDRNKWTTKGKTKRYGGKWIATNPGHRRSGYEISQMMKLNATLADLWRELLAAEGNDEEIQLFFNSRLGLEYSGSGAQVTRELIENCVQKYTRFESYSKCETSAGVDVGKHYDVQISLSVSSKEGSPRRKMILSTLRCESWNEVASVFERFNVTTAAIDSQPETNPALEFQSNMSGATRVILVRITGGRQGQANKLRLTGWALDEEHDIMTVDRDWLLSESHKMWQQRKVIVPQGYEDFQDGFWLESMESLTKVLVKDEERYRWSKVEGKDHFRFADAFDMLAWMEGREPVLYDDLGLMLEQDKRDGMGPDEINSKQRRMQNYNAMQTTGFGILKPRTVGGLNKRGRR